MNVAIIKWLPIIIVVIFSVLGAQTIESSLWGKNGEKWDSLLIPDFTSAGYRNGKVPIPEFPLSVNVKAIGAKGDGASDDTKYFRDAISQCAPNGAVFIPSGTYLITDTLQIKTSGIVLRGQSDGTSIVLFSKGLEELYPLYNGSQTSWSWSGAMILFKGNISDVGVENLTIRFPDNPWEGHNFHERGYNAIGFSGSSNGWVKHVTITGADLGIWIAQSSSHISITHLTMNFGTLRSTPRLNGHHGINCYGSYNILSNFEFDGQFCHDISLESKNSHHNVFMQGKGEDICFDHHSQDYNQKYNLFTEIDIGKGSHIYESGGNLTPRGVSFNETWWNIKSVQPVKWVTSMGESRNNVQVGINSADSSAMPDQFGNYYEKITPQSLSPKNLYWAQMKLLHNIDPPDSGAVGIKVAERYQQTTIDDHLGHTENSAFNLLGKRVLPDRRTSETSVISSQKLIIKNRENLKATIKMKSH